MLEAITSNRRRIDPYLLFVFIILYKNTRNQTHRSCCVLFILPSVAGPYKYYKVLPVVRFLSLQILQRWTSISCQAW